MNTNPTLVSEKNATRLCRPESFGSKFIFKARAVALAVTLAALAPLSGLASTIYWGAVNSVSSDMDVTNTGTALYAYTGGSAATVNGVTFSAGTGFAAWGNVSFTSGFTASSTSAFTINAGPFNTLSTVYSNILVGAAYGGTAAGTVTLKGLTAGHDYAVQIWVNDPRSGTSATRTETITNNGVTLPNTSVQLQYNIYNAGGGLGQFSVGYFAADNTNQTVTLVPSASTPANAALQLNAISVRDLGLSQRIWLGSSDNSWGTPANWSPGLVPISGDSITFNASSTANLGTLLDTSYTVGNLILSGAPAISIGSDGNVLTVNNGINLVSASDKLTINDAVVLGGFQTWTNNGSVTVNANVSGSAALTIAGNGVVTFTQPASYLYKTIISGGTLALSGSGSLTSVPIAVAGGATFDVSAVSGGTYYLNSATLTNNSAGAVINGNIDCSSGTITMSYQGGAAPFIQTNGTLTLASSTVVNIDNPGTVLAAGNYTIVAAAQTGTAGVVAYSDSLPSVNLTGNGAVGAATLNIDVNGNLQLVIATPDVWTGNGLDGLWNTANNWSPASVPGVGDAILFNSSSVNNLSSISQNDGVGGAQFGLSVLNPAGPVTIGGPQSLAIFGGGLNLSAASQNLTIAAPLVLNANQNWIVTNARTLTIAGPVTTTSGANVTITGGGTVQMGANNVLTGLTNASTGAGDLTVNSTLDLKGTAQAINGLSGSGVVDSTAGSTATLTVGGNGDSSTFSGILQNTSGALQLLVAGGNVQLLATNTYSGGTIFNGGTLWFPNSSALSTGPVTFNPGSGSYTVGRTFTNTLTLNGAYLRVGGANNNVQTWSGAATVNSGFSMSGDVGTWGITLSGPINIGTGGISITNSGGNGPQEGYNVSLTGDLLSGSVSGSGGITYYLSGGSSRLTVQGANSYSGGTIVNGDPANPGGKLNVWGSVNPFSTGSVMLNANAIIEAAPGNATITNSLTLNGGTLQSEPQYNNYNTLTWTGPISVTADSTLIQNATGALNSNQSSGVNVSGSLNMINSMLTCSCSVACYGGNTISGSISGTGTILENGNNSLVVSGSNTFSGTFRSVLGTLNVQNAYALKNATLDMNGADTGAVSLNNLNHVIGALTGSRNLALGSGTVSIGNNNTTTTYDGVLSGANLVKLGSGTLTLTALNSISGNTTVAAGTLSLQQPSFSFGSTVTVSNGAVLNLNEAVATTNVVTALVLNGVSQSRGLYNSVNASPYISGNGVIQVGASTVDIWTGAVSSEWSINNLGSPFNWSSNGMVGFNYTDGSAVQFDDSAANTIVDISVANVTPLGLAFYNTNKNYSFTGTSGITGTASVSKNGPGSVTFLNPNAFTGNMAINGGTVTVGSGGTLGGGTTYPGAISFANNSTLEYSNTSVTLSGNLTGAGALNFDSGVSGPSLTLSGVNSYSGVTTISNTTAGGSRIVAVPAAVSPNSTFNIVGTSTGGGQLFINGAATIPNNFTISGVGYKESGTGNQDGAIRLSAGDTLTGTITLAGNARISGILGTGTETISGQITGNGAMDFYIYFLNPNQANTILLANTNLATPNNYTGNTLVENQFNSGSSAGNNTILKLGASEQIPNGPGKGILNFTGYGANRLTTLELNGFNETVNGLLASTAGPYSIIQNTTVGASTLTVGDGNTNSSFSGNITDGGITKSLALTKIGTGTLTLSGIDTYNGGTAISGGTLLINNATGSSGTGTNAVNINNGGTLGGTGFISSLVSNNAGGTLYPGSGGSGKLTLSGNVTLKSGSTNTFVVNGATSNSVVVGAAVTYGGVLNIVTNGTFTLGQKFTLFSGTGATNTSNFASLAGNPGAGLAFSFTNGVLSVVTASVGPSGPATLTNSISGNTLSLSWPAGQGWRLQIQTNSLSVGLSGNWTYITDGSLSSTNITVDSTKPTVFYRLAYP